MSPWVLIVAGVVIGIIGAWRYLNCAPMFDHGLYPMMAGVLLILAGLAVGGYNDYKERKDSFRLANGDIYPLLEVMKSGGSYFAGIQMRGGRATIEIKGPLPTNTRFVKVVEGRDDWLLAPCDPPPASGEPQAVK